MDKDIKKKTKSKKSADEIRLERTQKIIENLTNNLNSFCSGKDKEGNIIQKSKEIRDIVQSITKLQQLAEKLKDKA